MYWIRSVLLFSWDTRSSLSQLRVRKTVSRVVFFILRYNESPTSAVNAVTIFEKTSKSARLA